MSDVKITVLANGPLLITAADAEMTDGATGAAIPIAKLPIALCRCGASKNRPFCDGSHKPSGFDGTCARQAP